VKGWILLNGNIKVDVDFIHRHSERILQSHHADASVRRWRKVLLVTAAWQDGEFRESHVKDALIGIGIPSRHESGHERNLQNLSVYHDFRRFMEAEPEIRKALQERDKIIRETKEFYRRKNQRFLGLLREQTRYIKKLYPEMTLADILERDVSPERELLRRLDERQFLLHYCCADVQDTLRKIVENVTSQ
jgi:hypothetical protein